MEYQINKPLYIYMPLYAITLYIIAWFVSLGLKSNIRMWFNNHSIPLMLNMLYGCRDQLIKYTGQNLTFLRKGPEWRRIWLYYTEYLLNICTYDRS